MRALKLTKIIGGRGASRNEFNDSDDPSENPQPAERTTPVVVNLDRIRCITPRRDDMPGTRITFADGGGFAVAEPFDQIANVLQAVTASEA